MRLLQTSLLYDYAEEHPEIMNNLKAWIWKVSKAKWKKREDVLESLPKTTFTYPDQALFEIAPNHHYLSAMISYSAKAVVIKKVSYS